MRILVCDSDLLSENTFGAGLSLICLLSHLKENYKEVTVDVLQTFPIGRSYEWVGQAHQIEIKKRPRFRHLYKTLYNLSWLRELNAFLKSSEHRYDLIITENEPALAAINAGFKFKIPTIFFVRSLIILGYEHISGNIPYSNKDYAQYPFILFNQNLARRALQRAGAVVSNSVYVQNALKNVFAVDNVIVYPPIKPEDIVSEQRNPDYVTFINPRTYTKGVDIFVKITRELPETKFLVAGEVYSAELKAELKSMPNVKLLGHCHDMKEVFAKSRIVLVPTRINEPFGRVAAEAMMNGIPCVVSARGGLPEVVGHNGYVIEDVENVAEWVNRIKEVEAALSANSIEPECLKKQAMRFNDRLQYQRFEAIFKEVTGGKNR